MPSASPPANRLLAALPPDVLERLRPHLRAVDLSHDEVLYEPDGVRHRLYFPTTAIVSLVYVTERGDPTQIAMMDGKASWASACSSAVTPHTIEPSSATPARASASRPK